MTSLGSALYLGRVMHRRLRPRSHTLTYRVFWMLIDLDEIDQLDRSLKVFSAERWNLFSFNARDYGDRSGTPLRQQVDALLSAAGFAPLDGPIRLLTMPRMFGYAFNPLSVFFCYKRDGSIASTIYEVHNTFGETHHYIMPAEGAGGLIEQASRKAFHVSPFLGTAMDYSFRVTPPADDVAVAISASDEEGIVLNASLGGKRKAVSDRALLQLLLIYPLLTLKVTAAIHWHALKLLLKSIAIVRHPGNRAKNWTVGKQSR